MQRLVEESGTRTKEKAERVVQIAEHTELPKNIVDFVDTFGKTAVRLMKKKELIHLCALYFPNRDFAKVLKKDIVNVVFDAYQSKTFLSEKTMRERRIDQVCFRFCHF